MTLLITKEDLENRETPAQIQRWSQNGNDALITGPRGAIPQAISKMRDAALNVFTAESWDAMTEDQLPGVALNHLVSDAIDILSSGLSRGDSVQTNADEAAIWRRVLASGKVNCFEGILVRKSTGTGGASLRAGAPDINRFDPDNPFSPTSRNLWPT